MCCKHTSHAILEWNGGCCLPLWWWPGGSVWTEEVAAWSVSHAGERPWHVERLWHS